MFGPKCIKRSKIKDEIVMNEIPQKNNTIVAFFYLWKDMRGLFIPDFCSRPYICVTFLQIEVHT